MIRSLKTLCVAPCLQTRSLLQDRLAQSGVLLRLAALVQGVGLTVSVIAFMSPEEQGKWYTFLSVVSTAGMTELGFGNAVFSLAARAKGTLERQTLEISALLRAVLRSAPFVIAAYSVVLVGYAHFVFLDGSHAWKRNLMIALLLTCMGGATYAWLSIANSYFEGLGYVLKANLRRMVYSLCYSAVCILGLWMGAGLLAIGVGMVSGAAITLGMMLLHHGQEAKILLASEAQTYDWRRRLLPLQLRYAASWLAGTIIVATMNPCVFRFVGAAEAGRFGITWSACQMISGLAGPWVLAHAAELARRFAGGDHVGFWHLYWSKSATAAVVYGVLWAGLTGLLALLEIKSPEIRGRFIGWQAYAAMSTASAFGFAIYVLALFMRSFCEEPVVKDYWLGAMLFVLLAFPFGHLHGALGVALALLVAQSAVLASVLRKFAQYRIRLQAHYLTAR